MSRHDASGGALTGATGDLTPDDRQRDFEPGELREVADPQHHADVTRSQGARAPAQSGEVGEPGRLDEDGPTNLASRESGYGSEHGLSPDDPAYRMESRPAAEAPEPPGREARLGGDETTEGEDRF